MKSAGNRMNIRITGTQSFDLQYSTSRLTNAILLYTSYRYIFSMSVADYTGQAWMQGFNDVGLIIFGMPATEICQLKVC